MLLENQNFSFFRYARSPLMADIIRFRLTGTEFWSPYHNHSVP